MENPKLSVNLLVAFSSLAATIAASWGVFSLVLSGMPNGPPLMAMSLSGAMIILGILFLPLLLWHQPAGYIGAIVVGIMGIIGSILGLRDSLTGVQPIESSFVILVMIAISVVLVVFSVAAWREKI